MAEDTEADMGADGVAATDIPDPMAVGGGN